MAGFKQNSIIVSNRDTPVTPQISGDLSIVARNGHLKVFDGNTEGTIIYESDVSSISASLLSQIVTNNSLDANQATQIASLSGNNISVASQISALSASVGSSLTLVQVANASANSLSQSITVSFAASANAQAQTTNNLSALIFASSGTNISQAFQISALSGNSISVASQIAALSSAANDVSPIIVSNASANAQIQTTNNLSPLIFSISGNNISQTTQIAALSGNSISQSSQILAISSNYVSSTYNTDAWNITGALNDRTSVVTSKYDNPLQDNNLVYIGLNIKHSTLNTHSTQMAGRNGDFRLRSLENGAFTPWAKIWTDQNHGSGSGLNADMLDGQTGSYYTTLSINSSANALAQATSLINVNTALDVNQATQIAALSGNSFSQATQITSLSASMSGNNTYISQDVSSYVGVTSAAPQELLFKGESLPSTGRYIYRVHMFTKVTGTDTGSCYLIENPDVNGFVLFEVTRRGYTSNYPKLILDGGVVKVGTNHTSPYDIHVIVERMDCGASTIGAKATAWGADAIVNVESYELKFRDPSSTSVTYTIWNAANSNVPGMVTQIAALSGNSSSQATQIAEISANDLNVVHISGSETIYGSKDFVTLQDFDATRFIPTNNFLDRFRVLNNLAGFYDESVGKLGSLVITLPVTGSTAFFGMKFVLYEYGNGKGVTTVDADGYTFQGTYNTAQATSDKIDRVRYVRFAVNTSNGRNCILLSHNTSSPSANVWSYPQGFIKDMIIGYTGGLTTQWNDPANYSVSFATDESMYSIKKTVDLQGVSNTHTANKSAINAYLLNGLSGDNYAKQTETNNQAVQIAAISGGNITSIAWNKVNKSGAVAADVWALPRLTTTVNISATGWNRVAQYESNNGRGITKILVETTGGSYNPRQMEIMVGADWSTPPSPVIAGLTVTNLAGTTSYWSGVRLVKDNTNGYSYVEVNFPVTVNSLTISILNPGIFLWRLDNVGLPAPAGTVITEVTLENGVQMALSGPSASISGHLVVLNNDPRLSAVLDLTGGSSTAYVQQTQTTDGWNITGSNNNITRLVTASIDNPDGNNALNYFGINIKNSLNQLYSTQLAGRNGKFAFRSLENGAFTPWAIVWTNQNSPSSVSTSANAQIQTTNNLSSLIFTMSGNDATKSYVQSRGENLITNGSGLMGSNYNFSSLTFDQSDVFSGFGAFRYNGGSTDKKNDELLPVDVARKYRFSYYIKKLSQTNVETIRHYGYTACYDSDGFAIQPLHILKVTGSTYTTLAADLSSGATTMVLTDATGWYNGATAHQRSIGFWPYTNLKGYTYPDYTYTQNIIYHSTNGAWPIAGISGNTIGLTTPYVGAMRPAGTRVANMQSGGTYDYIAGSNTPTPSAWGKYEGTQGPDYGVSLYTPPEIGSVAAAGNMYSSPNGFRWGTALIKVGWLLSYQSVGTSDCSLSVINLELDNANPTQVANASANALAQATTLINTNTALDSNQAIQIAALSGGSSSSYLQQSHQTIGWNISGANNDKSYLVTTGIDNPNGNNSTSYYGINIRSNTSSLYSTQLAGRNGDFAFRSLENGAFTPWARVWTTQNSPSAVSTSANALAQATTLINTNTALDSNQAIQIAALSGNSISQATQIAAISAALGTGGVSLAQVASASANALAQATSLINVNTALDSNQAIQITALSGNSISQATQIAQISASVGVGGGGSSAGISGVSFEQKSKLLYFNDFNQWNQINAFATSPASTNIFTFVTREPGISNNDVVSTPGIYNTLVRAAVSGDSYGTICQGPLITSFSVTGRNTIYGGPVLENGNCDSRLQVRALFTATNNLNTSEWCWHFGWVQSPYNASLGGYPQFMNTSGTTNKQFVEVFYRPVSNANLQIVTSSFAGAQTTTVTTFTPVKNTWYVIELKTFKANSNYELWVNDTLIQTVSSGNLPQRYPANSDAVFLPYAKHELQSNASNGYWVIYDWAGCEMSSLGGNRPIPNFIAK